MHLTADTSQVIKRAFPMVFYCKTCENKKYEWISDMFKNTKVFRGLGGVGERSEPPAEGLAVGAEGSVNSELQINLEHYPKKYRIT